MTTLYTQDQSQNPSDLDLALRQAFAVRDEPPATLQARLDAEHLRSRSAGLKRQSRRRIVRRGLTLASAACAVAFASVMLPKILVRRVLAQMASAAENVRSMHRVVWIVEEDGSRRKIEETWFQGGRWRIERGRNLQIHTRGKSYFYEPRARLATWNRQADGPFSNNASGFSIRALIADVALWKWSDKITLAPDVQVLDGRRARVATIEPARENIRIVLYAEPETLLPFRFDLQEPTRDGWKLSQTSAIEYNLPLQASLFEPRFPLSTRVIDARAEREEWARSLQKPRAVVVQGKQRIAVRDVQMNERGEVFVLYTAGRQLPTTPFNINGVARQRQQSWSVPYVWLGLESAASTWMRLQILHQPFIASANGPGQGVTINGEPLKWAIWTRSEPLAPGSRPGPQRLKLSIRNRGATSAASVSLSIPRATFTLLPAYARHAVPGMTEADLLNAVDEVRAQKLRHRFVYYTSKSRPQEARQAVTLYRAIIARTEEQWRAEGNSGVQPDKWLTLAELCLKLGQREEARQALERAEQDIRIHPSDGDTRRLEEMKQQLEGG